MAIWLRLPVDRFVKKKVQNDFYITMKYNMPHAENIRKQNSRHNLCRATPIRRIKFRFGQAECTIPTVPDELANDLGELFALVPGNTELELADLTVALAGESGGT